MSRFTSVCYSITFSKAAGNRRWDDPCLPTASQLPTHQIPSFHTTASPSTLNECLMYSNDVLCPLYIGTGEKKRGRWETTHGSHSLTCQGYPLLPSMGPRCPTTEQDILHSSPPATPLNTGVWSTEPSYKVFVVFSSRHMSFHWEACKRTPRGAFRVDMLEAIAYRKLPARLCNTGVSMALCTDEAD